MPRIFLPLLHNQQSEFAFWRLAKIHSRIFTAFFMPVRYTLFYDRCCVGEPNTSVAGSPFSLLAVTRISHTSIASSIRVEADSLDLTKETNHVEYPLHCATAQLIYSASHSPHYQFKAVHYCACYCLAGGRLHG